MNYTGKEYEVYPKMDAYKAIKSLPMLQESTEYEKPDTGETTIIILNESIWMGDQMGHILVNPNQLCYYIITVQDNLFANAPIFTST